MATISLCMIVRNEEKVLARCLESVKEVADEIIIVDTGSGDSTMEIARGYTDKVYEFAWTEDFAAARNASFLRASQDYCMWMDADDVLLEKDRKALLEYKKEIPDTVDIVMMKYNTGFDETGKPTYSYYRERLIRNFKGYQWEGPVHEVIALTGELAYTDIAVTHQKISVSDPDRNLRIFEKQLADGKKLDTRQQFYYARELYYHDRTEESCTVLEDFFHSAYAFLENRIEACRLLAQNLYKQGEGEKAICALFRSFLYDVPRAEICCDIGAYFFERGQLLQAVYWYQSALACQKKDTSGGFIEEDCYGYIPYLQLCVCYDKLGNKQQAFLYNEAAGRQKADGAAYLYNKKYFEQLGYK